MVEIRISGSQSKGRRADSQQKADVFVFDDESDAILVQRWQRGDIAAASIAIQRHETMVYAAVYRLLHNHAVSEDVCQDAFLRAHQRIDSLLQPAAFPGWLRQIAVRMAIDELRRRTAEPLVEDRPDSEPGPETVLETQDALERFRALLDALPSAQRAAVVLRDVEGFSLRETAQMLDISVPAVKMRLNRAYATLKQELQPGQDEEDE